MMITILLRNSATLWLMTRPEMMISMTAILLRMSTKCLLARAAELSSKWYKGGIGTNVFVKAWLCDKTGKDKINFFKIGRFSRLMMMLQSKKWPKTMYLFRLVSSTKLNS